MTKVAHSKLVEDGAVPPDDFHTCIPRLREIADYELELPEDFGKRITEATGDLALPPNLLRAVVAALRVGHVVLQGPPGTGKSSLIRAVAAAFNVSTFAVTAHEDWTTYDVIGRLELRLHDNNKEEIVPVNGALTEAVVRCGNAIVQHFDNPQTPQAEWLLIDELNRAHFDKAFGELFSVLGTDDLVPVNLPHQKEGNRELVLPRRFRIVATLNSYDRQFVQGLSQALRRRFTFISLDVPPKRGAGVDWAFDPASEVLALREFSYVLQKATARVARRATPKKPSETAAKIMAELQGKLVDDVRALFDLVERVRYAEEKSGVPHLPIGTAQLIDVVELYLTRHYQDEELGESSASQVDWAVTVKLASLFEADAIDPAALASFAESLSQPFDKRFKRELLTIAASGLHFVSSGT